MASTLTTGPSRTTHQEVRPHPSAKRRGGLNRVNWFGGALSWVWLLIVMIPIYWIVITSFKTQGNYFLTNPFAPPTSPVLDNYKLVIQNDFVQYFINSVIVSVGAVVPAVLIAFMAAYAIVRGSARSRFLRLANGVFLMGLAIPLQATIIPVYLIIIRLKMYDTLTAIILPSIAFALPLSVLVLSNFIRDVPKELFESMRLDGASEWGTLWRLVFPLTRPALVTVTIYNGLGIWNGFLLPLVLTQDPSKRTLPLALWTFQGQYGINVPAITASVVLTTLPILIFYAIGRRQLLSGLTAGFGSSLLRVARLVAGMGCGQSTSRGVKRRRFSLAVSGFARIGAILSYAEDLGDPVRRSTGGGTVRISDILRTKGDQVVTVTPDTTVERLLVVLAEHRIGAVVVSAGGTGVDGIVSERDVVRALAERGAPVLAEEVSVILTADVRTVEPHAELADVERLMTEHRFRHVPVVTGGTLHGIVSIGDVVKNRIDELETEKSELTGYITGDRF